MHDGNSRWWRVGLGHVLTILMALAFVAVPTSQAVALDKDQIVQMSKLGLETSAIKGAIDSSEEKLGLTEVEIGELRAQGVSDEVIAYLKDKGHVAAADKEGDEASASKEGDESTPDDEATPEETESPEGDETKQASGDQAAPAPGGGDAAPAPAPGEDEEKTYTEEELEEARQEAIEEEKARKRRRRKRQRAASRLSKADRMLEEGTNMGAARLYLKYLSMKPKEPEILKQWKGAEPWYEAKFGLGKALYKEGILSGAARPIQQVVMQGADRPHFQEAFNILQELTGKIGYQPPALEELTQVLTRDLPKKFRNDFNYYLGKFFYDYNRNKLAVKYLDKVKEGSADYPEALYLKGVAQLDPAIDDKPEALRNFERAIRAGEKQEESNEEILQLGYMALARVFYEVGLYDVALFYYQKIPRESSRHAEAMFEKAWTYFQKNDFKRALGTFQTLHSPYYEKWYFPDLYILESTVYLNLCQYGHAKQALDKFSQKYLDKRPRLKKFLEETSEPKAYWKKITRAYESGGVAKSDKLPEMFVNAVLDDLEFYNIYKTVRLLKEERSALKDNIGALGDFGEEVLDRVDQQVQTKVEEGGILVQQKLSGIDQELGNWASNKTKIEIDIQNEKQKRMQRRLQGRETKDTKDEAGTSLLIVADDWQPWPFEGEYWFDEVANYRSRQSSKCIEQQ